MVPTIGDIMCADSSPDPGIPPETEPGAERRGVSANARSMTEAHGLLRWCLISTRIHFGQADRCE